MSDVTNYTVGDCDCPDDLPTLDTLNEGDTIDMPLIIVGAPMGGIESVSGKIPFMVISDDTGDGVAELLHDPRNGSYAVTHRPGMNANVLTVRRVGTLDHWTEEEIESVELVPSEEPA